MTPPRCGVTLWGLFALLTVVTGVSLRKRLYGPPEMSQCSNDKFPCSNGSCISYKAVCDGKNDCSDGTDEYYCRTTTSCPTLLKFQCQRGGGYRRCIPGAWVCNLRDDCPGREDEVGCDKRMDYKIALASRKAITWLKGLRNEKRQFRKWGAEVTKIATVLHVVNETSEAKELRDTRQAELAYELGINVLSRLSLKPLSSVGSAELASHVHALLASCADPRDFFSLDLVEELRRRVFDANFTHPFVMLALCNAGERITRGDAEGLMRVFWRAGRAHWTDTQALTVLALSCAAQQPNPVVDAQELQDYTLELKNRQYRNGTVENLKTTALVMQAILSSDPEADEENFDEERALLRILDAQKPDGSFGSLVNTYYILPVLVGRSLVNISADHCNYTNKDEQEAYRDLANAGGQKWRVSYSVWFGDNRTVEKTLSLQVPENTTFYRVMELASDLDSRYRFEYTMRGGKPFPYSISGTQDDPENQVFWHLFTVDRDSHDTLTPINKSPADVTPQNKQHLVYWYRSRSWKTEDSEKNR